MSEQPIVVVRGHAEREVPPEQAVFTVSATCRGTDRETVLQRLGERVAVIRQTLDEATLVKRETGGFQVWSENRRGEKEKLRGSVWTRVTVDDFAELSGLMTRLAALEQTSVDGPFWQLAPGSKAGSDVRQEAVADALVQARAYAAAVGSTLDRLLEISDAGDPARPMFAMATPGSARAGSATIELDPENQRVSANVVVKISITEPAALN